MDSVNIQYNENEFAKKVLQILISEDVFSLAIRRARSGHPGKMGFESKQDVDLFVKGQAEKIMSLEAVVSKLIENQQPKDLKDIGIRELQELNNRQSKTIESLRKERQYITEKLISLGICMVFESDAVMD